VLIDDVDACASLLKATVPVTNAVNIASLTSVFILLPLLNSAAEVNKKTDTL
jgi:hypothetical protein